MTQPTAVKVQELVIVLATKGQSPSVLNAEFLRYSSIVPESWQLARKPIYTEQVIQIAYENGVVITAQPNRIILSELFQDKSVEDTVLPQIAKKLVSALPALDYEAVGINPRGYLNVAAGKKAASQYVTNNLLAPGPWQQYGKEPVKASVNYVYQLEQGRLNLSVSEASLQMPEEELSVILFSGNLDHALKEEGAESKAAELVAAIGNWQRDVASFTELVNSSFSVPEPDVPEVIVPDHAPVAEPAIA